MGTTTRRPNSAGGTHCGGALGGRLPFVRVAVLVLLLLLGVLSLLTAVLLALSAVDDSRAGLQWVNSDQLALFGFAGPGGSANRSVGGFAAWMRGSKLDPDFINKTAVLQLDGSWRKVCAPGCSARGNCNHEDGRCECPFGYKGPTCEVEMFPACKGGAAGSDMHCGDHLPRSCECLRQCYAHFCPDGGPCETHREQWEVKCWDPVSRGGGAAVAKAVTQQAAAKAGAAQKQAQKPGAAAAKAVAVAGGGQRALHQAAGGAKAGGGGLSRYLYSDVPEEGAPVEYYKGFRNDVQREKISRADALQLGDATVVPLQRCPQRCNLRGACLARGMLKPACTCWAGYGGVACEQALVATCVNRCQGRGTCVAGFCHCRPGYWGKDCSRSKAYPPHSATSKITKLRVYAYELPSHIAFDFDKFVGWEGHDPNYIAYKGFMAGFLNDWTIRTENPWEANMFYVPALSFAYAGGSGDAVAHLQRVMAWVRDSYPFFKRSGGHDHFFWMPGDWGACWVDPTDQLLSSAIKIVHFGFSESNTDMPGDFQLMPDKLYGCFRPGRDIVAAPYFQGQELTARQTYTSWRPGDVPTNRLLLCAGGTRQGDMGHVSSAQQELQRLFGDGKDPDVMVLTNDNSDYEQLVRTSKFCAATSGDGWSGRMMSFMVLGCVPVIVQDHVHQPFEDLLPYHKFSVRLPQARLAAAPQILRAIPDAEYVLMRANLAKYWHAFVWNPAWGGQAYNYTVLSLQLRLNGLLGGYF